MAAEPHGLHLSRRQFVQGASLTTLGLMAGCGRPSILPTPPSTRIPTIGIIIPPVEGPEPYAIALFQQGLRDLGYIEGESIAIEPRYGEGRPDLLPSLVEDLVSRKVDVIVAVGGAIRPATAATSTTPIVMINADDPVGQGLVASLAHPGGNVTGVSQLQSELLAKRLQLLKEVAPAASYLGIVGDGQGAMVTRAAPAAEALGIRLRSVPVPAANAVNSALEDAVRSGVDSLLVVGTPASLSARNQIVQLATEHRLPAIYDRQQFVAAGGLLAYGANEAASFRRAAYYVDRILKGTSPADLPAEQPREFDFVINLTTAQALSLTIPQHVLLQATELIQ